MDDGMIGEVRLFAGKTIPANWALCDGRLLQIAHYPALFSVLGTHYGGDARNTFGLPNMAGRAVVHPGQGPGLTNYQLGQVFGEETNKMNSLKVPRHKHKATIRVSLTAQEGSGDSDSPKEAYISTDGTSAYSETADTNMKGSNINFVTEHMHHNDVEPIDNMQPSLVLNYIICVNGIYPRRN